MKRSYRLRENSETLDLDLVSGDARIRLLLIMFKVFLLDIGLDETGLPKILKLQCASCLGQFVR